MSTTDDTQQRSVAEIIGWTWDRSAVNWRGPDGEIKYDSDLAETPTPDDMLAWLRDQGFLASIIHWKHGFDVVVRRDYGREHHDTHAPTLHAALEAAVRAVAEASDE